MPLYEYVCKTCGKISSLLIGVTAEKETIRCQHCGGTNLTKKLSAFSVGKGADPADDCTLACSNTKSTDKTCSTRRCPSAARCKRKRKIS